MVYDHHTGDFLGRKLLFHAVSRLGTGPQLFAHRSSRPRSMEGGDLHWIWEPYGIYQRIDYVRYSLTFDT
jgi:hypothetical protein